MSLREDWFDKPMRWAQLTLVENDPGNFDLDFWLDYFRRVHADGACLSAGGYVAYYPTDIPLHHRSAWLGDGDAVGADVFGDLVAGCREMDMVVLARTDPHAIHQDAADAHPEWIAVDAEGNPRRHWSMPDVWVTCALGPYNFEFMTEVHREIVRATAWRASSAIAGPGTAFATASTASALSARRPGWICPAPTIHVIRRGAPTCSGGRSGSLRCVACGTMRSARSTRGPVTSPTPAAARSARST